jgi:hypothetical protein
MALSSNWFGFQPTNEISSILLIRKSLSFRLKKITICNASPHKEDPIQTKKILISLFVFSALLVSGYNYFQSSSQKHREFLLNQALLPSFTRSTQAESLNMSLEKVSLSEESFVLLLTTPETDPTARKELEEKASVIVREWQKTQLEFKNYQFQITFKDSPPQQEIQ